jgi:WD40 repeat protein
VFAVAFDARGGLIVTGDQDGFVRVGPISGETPHILFGHSNDIVSVAVHPEGRWIASAEGSEPTVRLWPMPEGPPLQTLPYEEFMERLRAFTNLRAVPDERSATGYSVELGPFPGWETAPK